MNPFTLVSSQLRIPLNKRQEEQLAAYSDSLLAENARAGLMSSATTREDLYARHLPEALFFADLLDLGAYLNSPVIDIGSGGGLPGIVLKIARPTLSVTLLEATSKKAAFLEDATSGIGLRDITVLNARAEEVGHQPAHREAYALAVARAVAPLPVLLELSLPLVAVGGVLAAVKGSRAGEEVTASASALEALGGEVEALETLRAGDRPAQVVIVRKTGRTPDRYPRRPGMPAKRPL
jgi:16S rRNA (guanine527-N7)-methyltransferase